MAAGNGGAPGTGPHLVCITRPDLGTTNRLLEAACTARGVTFVEVTAGRVRESRLGDQEGARLLYCPAADPASAYLEKLLYGPGVAAFHDPWFPCVHPAITLQRSGVPVAPKVYQPSPDRLRLAEQVAWLGGFPVVAKLPGTEGGHGVLLIDGPQELETAMSRATAGAYLEAFVPHRLAYRLLVIGDEVTACTAAAPAAGDFRSNAASARDLGPVAPPEEAGTLARRAAAALRLELGGVDLLHGDDGSLLVSEVNCPCYFADQQAATGRDLAGAMIDHLLTKSRALADGL